MTVLGTLLAVLAGLLRDLVALPQLAASPSGLTALAAAVLAGAMFAAVLALLTSVASISRTAAALPMTRRASARGVPAPARSRRGGPAQTPSTFDGPGGRPLLLTSGR
jgi:hypothetical protein